MTDTSYMFPHFAAENLRWEPSFYRGRTRLQRHGSVGMADAQTVRRGLSEPTPRSIDLVVPTKVRAALVGTWRERNNPKGQQIKSRFQRGRMSIVGIRRWVGPSLGSISR